ncbi:putative capsular polysaccharide synthesis family protein [Lichenibacterium dinghuense]|uniref:putative capsular polysaccharide synthesis family protein n=1 Tax=Lichenibacterium dinghuense TaxID=2895977 RepID=UPI001F348419|nr:putative capsular polysaccharide synthesis family protein [Lichenibacterium sp. 6Y81]
MPPAVDDPNFAGFLDDAAQEMRVVRCGNATEVLLVFCGRHGSLGFPLPIAHRWFAPLGVHVVYLRDPDGELYAGGLRTLGGDRGATIRTLRGVVDELGATRIACYGNSNGGYAALLYGLEMGAAAVLAVNAMILISEEQIVSYRGADRRRPHLPDLARLYATASPRPRVCLVHSADNAQDAAAALALAGISGVTVEAVPDVDGHDAHMALIEGGQFGDLLRRALMDADAPSGPVRTGEDAVASEKRPEPASPTADDPLRPTSPGGDLVPTPEAAWREGVALRDEGRAAQGLDVLARAFADGYRHLAFLRDYLDLLSGEARYAELLSVIDILRREGVDAAHARAPRHLAMISGHAKLALMHPRDEEIAAAGDHAASEAWLDAPALRGAIASAIRARRPFAFIRVGDGEARYLIGEGAEVVASLGTDERGAMLDVVWENWFGETASETQAEERARLRASYERAILAADVVGACSAERLRRDTAHYGYLAWQERWLRRCFAGRPDVRFTDALVLRALDAETPFLTALLKGQDVLGMISPHPGLAQALARRAGIGRVIEHVVPGEQRLPSATGAGPATPHFPTAYERLMDTLSVPRPGCVFLVAAGLLGKVYCARIKALGGIAVDIGALADAWLGFDTRNGWYANTSTLDVSAPPQEPEQRDSPPTLGCLSFGKTGSMALAAALHSAGFPNAIHLHFLGPRAMALKGTDPEPMCRLASKVARTVDDPERRFRFVTSIRDPVARILSQAFYTAERHRAETGADIVRDREALIAWWDGRGIARIPDLWGAWFDDTYKATFGFDVREHRFDHARKSLRFASDRLRVLVLRQEDALAAREAELGWLVDRDRVAIPFANTSESQGYDATYRPFLASFVAPPHWLDSIYESEVIRHLYTEAERDAFRFRWSGKGRSYRLGAVAASSVTGDGIFPVTGSG